MSLHSINRLLAMLVVAMFSNPVFAQVQNNEPLRFTADMDKSSVCLSSIGEPSTVQLAYRVNGGAWQHYEINTTITLLTLGEWVEFQASGCSSSTNAQGETTWGTPDLNHTNSTFSSDEDNYYLFLMDGSLKASGQLGSLLKSAGQTPYSNAVPEYGFYHLFAGCHALKIAPYLPSGLSANCYNGTFLECTGLKTPAEGIATSWGVEAKNSCFYEMYKGCSSLESIIQYTNNTNPSSHAYMFAGCTALSDIPDFPSDSLSANCYEGMFSDCTGLTTAPSLPVTSLAQGCYKKMFSGCTELVNAPALPATTLQNYCYQSMFEGCSSLEFAPSLPATKLSTGCYEMMFRNCSSLNNISVSFTSWGAGNEYTSNWVSGVSPMGTFVAPNTLPNTRNVHTVPVGWNKQTVSNEERPDYFYILSKGMNISIDKSVPLLYSDDECATWKPIALNQWTSNFNSSYFGNGAKIYFKSAKGNGTFSSQETRYKFTISGPFETGGNIISLIDPTCQMTEVPDYAFAGLFEGNSGMQKAPELPFTTLGEGCYMNMFKGTGLTEAPELPATNLAESCYEGMFQNCTSLKSAPKLPAIEMKDRCYALMFNGCSSLNWMSVSFTYWGTINDKMPTYQWINNVPKTGLFVKPNELSATYNNDGHQVPLKNETGSKWNTMQNHLCFTALDNVKVRLVKSGNPTSVTIKYRKNNDGEGTLTITAKGTNTTKYWIDLKAGDRISFRGNAEYNSFATFSGWDNVTGYYNFEIQGGRVAASGNVISLLQTSCLRSDVPDFAFYRLFADCAGLIQAPELPATKVGHHSYKEMFLNCTGLKSAPELPATALGNNCYQSMFEGCTALTYVPDLSAQIIPVDEDGAYANSCYQAMFKGCSALVNAPALNISNVTANCFQEMFKNCTSLVNAPELLAIIPNYDRSNSCYESMFEGCASLKRSPYLPTQNLSGVWNAYRNMFKGCTSLEYINVGLKDWYNENTADWTKDVPMTGVFVCDYDLIKNGAEYGTSRIPYENRDGRRWSVNQDYLCFTAESAGATVKLNKVGSPAGSFTIYTSTDGKNWGASPYDLSAITLKNKGDQVYFKTSVQNGTFSSAEGYYQFVMQGSIKASGNVLSLLNCYCQSVDIPDYAFQHLFDGCVSLTSTPTMPSVESTLGEGCYSYMYNGCKRIERAPNLPATTLADACYDHMFAGCTKLAKAPALPATVLTPNCYNSMFKKCQWLTTAPELPAQELVDGCYNDMFNGCIRLKWMSASFVDWQEGCTDNWVKDVPKQGTFESSGLSNIVYGPSRVPKDDKNPWVITYDALCFTAVEAGATVQLKKNGSPNAVTLEYSYNNIYWRDYAIGDAKTLEHVGDKIYFRSKSNVANNLFSKDVNNYYSFVFNNKKVAASGSVMFLLKQDGARNDVPNNAFYTLFLNCSSLVTAPSLPAIKVGNSSYLGMFRGCTNLTVAPALPAKSLGTNCYQYMFRDCTSLTQGPVLPAENLTTNCYNGMFYGCTSLTAAPELFSTYTPQDCYKEMFYGCSSLNYINVGFSSWSASNDASKTFTSNWVKNVPNSGFFFCPEGFPEEYSDSRIPKSNTIKWTVVHPFCMTATGSVSVALQKEGTPNVDDEGNAHEAELEYSLDGRRWSTYKFGTVKNLSNGEKIFFRAADSNPENLLSTTQSDYYHFSITGSGTIAASGNLMCLLDKTGARQDVTDFAFARLFEGCTKLTAAPDLPASTLGSNCYYNMFSGCTALTTAPALNAATLGAGCYYNMFSGCTALTTAPNLPAKELADNCYYHMFYGCTSLVNVSTLLAETLKARCYEGMFQNCSNLVTPPNIMAKTVDVYSCASMFKGCSKIVVAPYLRAKELAMHCYEEMFENCTSLEFISVEFEDWKESQEATTNWVKGVSNNPGHSTDRYKFMCPTALAQPELEYGVSRCPDGWNRLPQYLCFTAETEGATVQFVATDYDAENITTAGKDPLGKHNLDRTKNKFQYSTDGYHWSDYSMPYTTGTSKGEGDKMTLAHVGDRIYFRVNNVDNSGNKFKVRLTKHIHQSNWTFQGNTYANSNPWSNAAKTSTTSSFYHFNIGGMVAGSGNIESLLDRDLERSESDKLGCYEFAYLFEDCTGLTEAPALPEKNLIAPAELPNYDDGSIYCYMAMFKGCTSLRYSPALPKYVNAAGTLHKFFMGCISLVEAPEMPATDLAGDCYNQMYRVCTGLEKAPSILPATEINPPHTSGIVGFYKQMFDGCTSLKRTPKLPLKSIKNGIYQEMFKDCTSLQYIEVGLEDWNETDHSFTIWEAIYNQKSEKWKTTTAKGGLKNNTEYTEEQLKSAGYGTESANKNWVGSWGDTPSKGIFVCPDILPQDADHQGSNFIPKGWKVVRQKIEDLPDENGEIPSGYTLLNGSTDLETLSLEDAEYNGYGMYGKTVIVFPNNGKDVTWTMPHYVKADLIQLEATTASENQGTISVVDSKGNALSEYENSLGIGSGLISAMNEASSSISLVDDNSAYGKSYTVSLSEGMYATATLYGEVKPHYKEPIMEIDYEHSRLRISSPDGEGVIYYSTSKNLSYDNYLKYGTVYRDAEGIDLSTYFNEASATVQNRTYYAIVAPDNYDWKSDESLKVPSAVKKQIVYRWPRKYGYYQVTEGSVDELKGAIKFASNVASATNPVKIFVPDGDYDLAGTAITIPQYVSLIGESNEATIISSSLKSAVVVVSGQSNYLQDICVRQDFDGSSAALQDKGTMNVYKNCRFVAKNYAYYCTGDGYNRNYLNDCELIATGNYAVYGNGDVWFEQCRLSSPTIISRQTTALTNRYGHIFHNCTVIPGQNKWYLSSPASGSPAAAWMKPTIDNPSGFTLMGYGSNSKNLALRYYDTFTGQSWSGKEKYKAAYNDVTIAFAQDDEYRLPAWTTPSTDVIQQEMRTVTLNNQNLYWESRQNKSNDVYLIEARRKRDGKMDYLMTDSKYYYFHSSDYLDGYDEVYVRVANDRGGFGERIRATELENVLPIDFKLNAYGFATFSSDKQVAFDGANAYIGKVVDDKVVLKQINPFDVVPAFVGVFLIGQPENDLRAIEHSGAGYSVASGSNDWLPNLSQRTFTVLESKSVHDCASHNCCYYVLQGENIVKRTTEGGGVKANRAYIHHVLPSDASAAPARLRICFGDEEEETGISTLHRDQLDGIYFNLVGQKSASDRGLLIRDGKVVMIK